MNVLNNCSMHEEDLKSATYEFLFFLFNQFVFCFAAKFVKFNTLRSPVDYSINNNSPGKLRFWQLQMIQ